MNGLWIYNMVFNSMKDDLGYDYELKVKEGSMTMFFSSCAQLWMELHIKNRQIIGFRQGYGLIIRIKQMRNVQRIEDIDKKVIIMNEHKI